MYIPYSSLLPGVKIFTSWTQFMNSFPVKILLAKYMSGLKVGRMTRTIWVIWVTFLEGQVGLICKLNYLDVTGYHMFFRKQC